MNKLRELIKISVIYSSTIEMNDKFTMVEPEDFVKLRFAATPRLSPDGGKLLFNVKSVNENKNTYKSAIYYHEVGKKGYRQFSAGTSVDVMPEWSPDGKLIAFLSNRSSETKGLQVHVMDASGGEAFRITKFPVGVIQFSWSNDSKFIHVITLVTEEETAKIAEMKTGTSFVLDPVEFEAEKAKKKVTDELKKDPRVITEGYLRKDTYYLDGRFAQPFIVSVSIPGENPEENEIIHAGENGYHYTLGDFSNDDSRLYTARFRGDPSLSVEQDILEIDLANTENKRVIETAFGYIEQIKVSPRGKYLSYQGQRSNLVYDDMQLFVMDLENNRGKEFICVTGGYERSVSLSQWINGEELLFISPSDGKMVINRIDVTTGEVTVVSGSDRNVNSFTAAGELIVFEASHAACPSDIYTCKKDGSGEEKVTELNKDYLEKINPATVDYFTYTREGVQQQGWVLLPQGHDGKKELPVALEIHGGPSSMWSPHERTMWHEWNALVAKGYAVVFCNPRGSGGYGPAFRGAVHKNWGKLPAEDIITALDTALEKYTFLDNERMAVTGGSYGGYMTAWIVTHYTRFKAAVSQRGVYEFAAFSLTTDIPVWFEMQYGGEVMEFLSEFMEDAPLRHVKNLETPLLIIHSDNDFRVPVVTAEMLFWQGKRQGKIVELVRYPREGHELSRSGEPRHVIDRINKIILWFGRYINGS